MSSAVDLPKRLAAEALGTLLLLATVVGSGIMAEQLADHSVDVLVAHAMFALDTLQLSTTPRDGPAQWFSEFVATFGLVAVILGTLRHGVLTVAASVGLSITAAYWFTASTSFANPAVTIGRPR